MSTPDKTIPLHVHIAYLFIGLITVFAVVTGWYQYQQTSKIMLGEAGERVRLYAEQTKSRVENLYSPAATFTDLLSRQRLVRAQNLQQRLDSLDYVVTGLRQNPELSSAYVGYDSGDFFLVRPWRGNTAVQRIFMPPAGTAWIVQSVERRNDRAVGQFLYFDANLRLIEQRAQPPYQFDPRVRPWFRAAKAKQALHVTDPDVFFTTREVGVTFARASDRSPAVAGTDLSLQTLHTLLSSDKITPSARIALLNARNEVFSWQQGVPALVHETDGSDRLPRLTELASGDHQKMQAIIQDHPDKLIEFTRDGQPWHGMAVSVPVPDAQPLNLWVAAPHGELIAKAAAILNRSIAMAALFLALGIGAAFMLSRLASRPLKRLTAEADKIERFEFDAPLQISTRITEIANLAHSMGSMKSTIQRFLDLSSALANETQFTRLLHRLLDEMKTVTSAHGGVVYLADGIGTHLQAAHADWRGRTQWSTQQLRLLDLDAAPTLSPHPVMQALSGSTTTTPLTGADAASHFTALPIDNEDFTLLTIPLRGHSGELLGALALFVDEVSHPLTPALLAFTHALSGTAAVALNTQRLIEEQKVLLEAFIQVMAGAIDAKSAYTGGHCQRVPVLTKLLAQAACQETEGPFASFQLSDTEWEELHIAAWLHDCGKVTTPEYIVDKATKLETLYDRIHEIRMRFEVLKRDAEISYWKALAATPDQQQQLKTELDKTLAELDEEFNFIATCNEGGEFMAPDKIARIKQIAERSWTRTLPDRIGISHDEKERKDHTPEPALPVQEQLLSDKPEHIFSRSERDNIKPDNPWGFRVKVPEHLYNRGEVYNLTVARGTLSEEERYKINEHMIQTIMMLEKLPFPRHLARVPEIAGGHHEKMDGTGYPKRLMAADMSIPARMMAIADIFEALTAADRPYKKGKTLSEAIKIMSFMKKDLHIDAELFELFLKSGVYLEYGKKFMNPEQLDDVDIHAYV